MIGNKTVAAIIAEYNPFHNGHEYHIRKTKELTGADYVIVLLSTNFVQRGEPAILDRFERAKAAIFHGVDAVFELPVTVSTGSADLFAEGSVALADRLGIVDYLSFGAEQKNLSQLIQITTFLYQNRERLENHLKKALATGITYPEARQDFLEKEGMTKEARLLTTSNNILAVSYLHALLKLHSDIKPSVVERKGVLHDAPDFHFKEKIASAGAIRSYMRSGYREELTPFLPSYTFSLMQKNTDFLNHNDFADLLFYRLNEICRTEPKEDACKKLFSFQEVSIDLAKRIYKKMSEPFKYENFSTSLLSKNYTVARLNRTLYHILLGIDKALIEENRSLHFCPYLRPLAIKKEALFLLGEIKKSASKKDAPPLLTRIGDIKKSRCKTAQTTFARNRAANALYAQISLTRHGITVHDETRESFMLLI